jgi:hypothetical protein
VSSSDADDYDMLQSTPELDDILASAQTEREVINCLKFKEKNSTA